MILRLNQASRTIKSGGKKINLLDIINLNVEKGEFISILDSHYLLNLTLKNVT